MKKLLLIVTILISTLIMSGCDTSNTDRYVIYNDDENTFMSCIVEDTLEDCTTVEVYTTEQVDQIIEQAILEAQLDLGFPIEPTEEQWEYLIENNLSEENLREAVYDVINHNITDEDWIEFVNDILDENGFYEEYDEVVYDYIEDFFEAMLLQILDDIIAESEVDPVGE